MTPDISNMNMKQLYEIVESIKEDDPDFNFKKSTIKQDIYRWYTGEEFIDEPECVICIEPFTKVTRKKIVCPSCEFTACSTCTKHYIMNETTQEAHCMNCKVVFTTDFLTENFTKTWNNCDYRNHRVELLVSEQKSHLPDTELYVQDLKKAEKLGEDIDEAYKCLTSINNKYSKLTQVHYEKIKELKEMIKIERDKINKFESESENEKNSVYTKIKKLSREKKELINGKKENKEKEKRKFLMRCCVEDCKGFINNKYKCGICETQMCGKCHKVKNEDHVCNEDDVKTVEMIKKTCKNCPKCGIPTHKISGCPQMWCIECHAVWNWNSETLDTSGRVHNPHYFQFLRNGDMNTIRREQGDVRCGGDVTANELHHSFNNIDSSTHPVEYGLRRGMINVGYSVIEDVNHVVEYDTNKFRAANPIVLRDLRVKYLTNKIGENEWKNELKKYERSERKKKEYREILELYTASIQDILRNSVDLHRLQIHDIVQMKKYTNGVFEKLNKQYGVKGFILRKRDIENTPYSKKMGVTHI